MKRFYILIIGYCIFVFSASGTDAQDYQVLSAQGGVEVMAAIDPLGPNNQIVAYIKFVNHNDYKVSITWTPIITCEGELARRGYGAPFDINAAGSYEVRLWRSSACMVGAIKVLEVDMDVSKAAASGE